MTDLTEGRNKAKTVQAECRAKRVPCLSFAEAQPVFVQTAAFINNFNYMDTISNVMFWLSNGFLIPVVVGLLFFFVWSVLLLGGFVSRYVQRARMEKELASLLEDMDKTKVAQLQLPEALSKTRFGQCMSRITASTYSEAGVGKLISEYELSCSKELNQAKILVKFGPILGLMGTLIPMGPALAGLSTGDIASMAYNMQVAFATTVLGLFAGAVGFVLYQSKQRWAQKDLVRLDFVAGLKKEAVA